MVAQTPHVVDLDAKKPAGPLTMEGVCECKRLVLVRYVLDRLGYTKDKARLEDGSCVFWRDPPAVCTNDDLREFLLDEGILGEGLLAQVFIEAAQSFINIDALGGMAVFNFADSSPSQPSRLDIRLTDMLSPMHDAHHEEDKAKHHAPVSAQCNMGPTGLLAFSWLVTFDTASRIGRLVDGFVEHEWVDSWMCYAFFGGLLEFVVAMWEVKRNNIYGATVFSVFGSFWMSSGLRLMLERTGQIEKADTPVGDCVAQAFLLAVCLLFFKQTFRMNYISMGVMVNLCFLKILSCVWGFTVSLRWVQVAIGILLSFISFYSAMAQITNEIYQRQVLPIFPAKGAHHAGVYEAAGNSVPLQARIAKMRTGAHKGAAGHHARIVNKNESSPEKAAEDDITTAISGRSKQGSATTTSSAGGRPRSKEPAGEERSQV